MRCIYLKLLVWPEKNRLWKAGCKGQTAPSSALTAAYHKEFTTERGGIVFSSWIDEKRVVLFNGPTLDVSEQTEGNPSPPDYRSRRAGEWSRPWPPSLPPSLLGGQNDFQLLVTGGIYINSWTAPVPARLQVASATKNAKGAPETKKSDTSDSNPPPPPPAPPVPNSFRLLWLRAGGLTQCCSLPVE